MKSFVILCILLGYFYTHQVDGNPLLRITNGSYTDRDVNWQRQAEMLLANMSSVINEINISVTDIYIKDNEYFDNRITRIKELIEKKSSQNKSMNSSHYIAAIPTFIMPIKNAISLCFNNVSKHIKQLEIKTKEDIEKKLVDWQVDTSDSGRVDFMYELRYQTKNSLRMELFESERMYIQCVETYLQIYYSYRFRMSTEESVTDEFINEIFYQKPIVETATNLKYENENALNGSIRAFVSKVEDIIKEANKTVVLAYTEDKKYIEFKTMKLNGRSDMNFMLTEECSKAIKNVTENIQNIVRPVSMKNASDCYSRFIEDSRHDVKGFDEYKKNPLFLAAEMKIPKGEAEWKEFMDIENYQTRYPPRTSVIPYFNCIKKNVEHLKKLLNIDNGLISKACFST